MKKQNLSRQQKFKLKHKKIRKKITGTSTYPRLCIYRSNTSLIAQIINDNEAKTLVYARIKQKNTNAAKELAKLISEKAKTKKIVNVVFDRSGYKYIGRVAVFAETCRKEGLKF